MQDDSFMLEVVGFMGSLGLSDLENSGLVFPAVDWDWETCCHACLWLACMGYELPGGLESRMLLGPMNMSVRTYVQLMGFRRRPSIWDLAG